MEGSKKSGHVFVENIRGTHQREAVPSDKPIDQIFPSGVAEADLFVLLRNVHGCLERERILAKSFHSLSCLMMTLWESCFHCG